MGHMGRRVDVLGRDEDCGSINCCVLKLRRYEHPEVLRAHLVQSKPCSSFSPGLTSKACLWDYAPLWPKSLHGSWGDSPKLLVIASFHGALAHVGGDVRTLTEDLVDGSDPHQPQYTNIEFNK